ncbi:MAG: homoserine dehydrogenase, partial [Chloroflexota bacterium]|nr:homoserine dehydrogenase [Chloroflexota bacterium]
MRGRRSIGIGLMGLGVVGGGVARTLAEKGERLAKEVGCPLSLRKVLVRDPSKERTLPAHLLTTDPQVMLADPAIDIIVEAMGGENPALEHIQAALGAGKQVVTANKEVIAKHGPQLFALAQQRGVNLLFEASVGGAIPVIAPFQQNLLANRISALHAIINGTTNYILTRMAKDSLEFQVALREAQELGYAEPNPENDIEGIDAAYKLSILASLAFHTWIYPDQVYREGISRLAARDFRYARELGYVIKLLAIAREEDGAIQARVHPTLLEEDLPLA